MNIAVIGAGRWGTNYIRTLLELGEEVSWVCARSNETLEKAAMLTKARTTTDYKKILNDKRVEAVAVVTDAASHYHIAKDAILAGKHVIIEKPMTLSSKEAQELAKLAEKKKTTLMAGHIHRYNKGIQKIKEDIDAGKFGKIVDVQTIGANNEVRRKEGALWDFGAHDITIATYLIGEYPESVSAEGNKDEFAMQMKFGNGTTATANGSWLKNHKKRDITVTGEKLKALFDDYAEEKLTYCDNKGNCKKIPVGNEKPLTEELKHFIECAKTGRKPITDETEGLKTVKILEAAQKSMDNNGKEIKTGL